MIEKNNDEHDSLAQETFCCSISTTDVQKLRIFFFFFLEHDICYTRDSNNTDTENKKLEYEK